MTFETSIFSKQNTQAPIRLDLFCKVVDNFGDIGICWRLSKQFASEYAIAVQLWVDDLASFKRLCPQVSLDQECQVVEQITVRHWKNQAQTFSPSDIADIVIEFFACDIPPDYIATMATLTRKPIWLNLEGLTAETWVEGCHRLPSSHPQYPLTKYFYYPGFTDQTGGLICEARLETNRQIFLMRESELEHPFLRGLGLSSTEIKASKVSLFCYPHAPVSDLIQAWCNSSSPVVCLVPEGVAQTALTAFFGATPEVGMSKTVNALTLRVIPFLDQENYDHLLWLCDVNFVRGEDSFVRAQWACKPFVWHIYPQDENLHHKKLAAFLDRHRTIDPAESDFSLAWNAVQVCPDWDKLWRNYEQQREATPALVEQWRRQMMLNGDFSRNLFDFVGELRKK